MKFGRMLRASFGASVLMVASILTAGLGLVNVMQQPAYAAPEDELPAYRIQMSPSLFDIELRPGKTDTQTFYVQNTGSQKFKYRLKIAPYSMKDEKYNPDYIAESQYTQITNWISLSKLEGELESKASDEIEVTINVPRDVPAGGQYATILAELVNDENSNNTGVAITQQVGIVIFSNVNGQTRNGGNIVENKISKFLFQPPISATSLIENTGNTHVKAYYTLQVFPLFGDEEVYTNEENPETRVILPETRRFNTVSWEGSPRLGLFRVRQTVRIYEEVSVKEKIVFICPVWFLFIIVLLLFCIGFWIVSRIRARRREV